jgi:sulfatase maturation enzyme AslB (radical SAM superfamily)
MHNSLPALNAKMLLVYPDGILSVYKGIHLLYSPMGRKGVWLDDDTIRKIKYGEKPDKNLQEIVDELTDFVSLREHTGKVKTVEDYPLLTVLPNQKCNLNCSYCYSANGRSNMELDMQKLKCAIDFFIDSKKHDKPLSISYMGGGEPMLSWELVSKSIVYAQQKSLLKNKRIEFTIITNGTVMTDCMLEFIKENNIKISISFEIIEEIQNKQRGQYQQVIKTLRKLISHRVIPQINSTITPSNVERLLEMYQLLDEQFPDISNMMFEPVTDAKLFSDAAELERFLKTYTDNFLSVDMEARKKNKSLTSFPYLRTVYPTERACSGEFCITADGKLSGCYCISTPVDTAYDRCIYGEILADTDAKGNKVCINKSVFENLLRENVYVKKNCEDCIVKWNCGGGCFHLYNSYPPNYQEVFCNFTREFVQKVVLRRFERLYEYQYGVSPVDNIQYIKSNYTVLKMK